MKDLKNVISAPTKEEAERMVKIAYYIDKRFLRPTDMVVMGIDVYRLKECGEVRMSKSPAELKKFTVGLWDRMTEPMKAMFLWSHLCQGVEELRALLKQFHPIIKNTRSEENNLDALQATMSMKLPTELQAKIKEGFGREWGK